MRSSKSVRWWDLPAALLLLVALLIASSRLIVTEWVDHLNMVHTLVFLGTIAGLALGQSRFSPGLATIFALLYGLFAVPWQLGLSLENLPKETLWRDRLAVLASRLLNALGELVQREPVQDPLLFLCGMALLFWALGVFASYTLTRRADPWRIILPPGLTVLIIQTSDPYKPLRVWYLAGYLFFSLLLLARLTYLHLRNRWQRDDARVPPLISVDLSYVVLVAASLLILLAWSMPVMADVLPSAREAWRRATRPWTERMDDVFASLRRRGGTLTVADYYSDTFPLGRGRELTDALALTVQSPPGSGPRVRYYWRARVYNHYADGEWGTTVLTETRRVGAGGFGLVFPDLEGRRTVTFTFASPDPIVTLYTAPQPRWVSRRVEVDLAENPDGTVDVAALHADPPLPPGQAYRARSSVSNVTITQLREAGTDYPQWVTDRYLQLPPTITPRTRELAQRLAGDLETPYDVTAIVTEYLRRNIDYSETISPTISDPEQEPVDWFLFDLRVGFCNYYATSEVILLRSAGIPARLAVGFAEGERQTGTNVYTVYERDAHAWPEVYFPGLGWVEFEPTVSQDPIYRPLGEFEREEEDDLAGTETGLEEDWRRHLDELESLDDVYPIDEPLRQTGPSGAINLLYMILPILALILIVLAWHARRRRVLPPLPILLETGMHRIGWKPPAFLRRWATLARLTALELAYIELDRALMRLGAPPEPADTPVERTRALARALPEVESPAWRLLAEYHATIYSPRPGKLEAAQQAARIIRRLSRRARLRRLLGRA